MTPQIVPPTSTPPAAVPATAAPVTPVEASVSSLPDKIAQLLRQIQVSGTIASPPDTGTLILATAVGEISLILPQLAQDEQQKLLQILNAMFQSQKPLTVVVQPGDPPSQVFILVPQTPPTKLHHRPQLSTQPSGAQAAARIIQTLAPGVSLPAIVLPPETLAALPSSGSTSIPLTPLTASAPQVNIPQPENILLQAVREAIQAGDLPAALVGKIDAALSKPGAPDTIADAEHTVIAANISAARHSGIAKYPRSSKSCNCNTEHCFSPSSGNAAINSNRSNTGTNPIRGNNAAASGLSAADR